MSDKVYLAVLSEVLRQGAVFSEALRRVVACMAAFLAAVTCYNLAVHILEVIRDFLRGRMVLHSLRVYY